MADLTPKRLLVLREMAELQRFSTIAAGGDGWLRAFHVRYFRRDSPAAAERMSLDSIEQHLGRLCKDGYVDKREGKLEYRINDKGRAAVAEADEIQTF